MTVVALSEKMQEFAKRPKSKKKAAFAILLLGSIVTLDLLTAMGIFYQSSATAIDNTTTTINGTARPSFHYSEQYSDVLYHRCPKQFYLSESLVFSLCLDKHMDIRVFIREKATIKGQSFTYDQYLTMVNLKDEIDMFYADK